MKFQKKQKNKDKDTPAIKVGVLFCEKICKKLQKSACIMEMFVVNS